MTPMIDIVFQLIAFFMVINNFEQTQANESVKLAASEMARPPEESNVRQEKLVVNIGFQREAETGEIVSKEQMTLNAEVNPMTLDQLRSRLKGEAQRYNDKKIPLSDVTIAIRADNYARTGIVQKVMEFSQEAGFEKFALRAWSDPKQAKNMGLTR